MDNLTYRRYLEDPGIREELDREVRRLRQHAIADYIVAPIGHALQHLLVTPIRHALQHLRRTAPACNAPVLTPSRTARVDTTVQRGDTLCIEDA
jgi:hypothetical protein